MSMLSEQFRRHLETGVEVAVASATPDKYDGVRDGFQRYFGRVFGPATTIAAVQQDEENSSVGLPVTDEETLTIARDRARLLAERLGDTYDFYVASEGGLAPVVLPDTTRWVARNWTVVRSSHPEVGEAWGSSGALQLPVHLVEGLSSDEVITAVPGTRRAGGLLSALTAGLETRHRAVELATVHALSSLFHGRLGSRQG